jgi:hypothetical protein
MGSERLAVVTLGCLECGCHGMSSYVIAVKQPPAEAGFGDLLHT